MLIDKLAWLCVRNRRVLMARSFGKELFYLPGGKREAGETDQQALLREIHEELSVSLKAETLEYAQTFRAQADGKAAEVEVQITSYFGTAEGTPTASSEIEELAWIGSNDRARCSGAALLALDYLLEHDRID